MHAIWSDLIELFMEFITYFTRALDMILEDYLNFTMKDFNIYLVLFLETLIFPILLYNLLNLVIFYILFKCFINTF